ncbi:MAG: 30S ribosomal protein S12 methylthiotransferase RimO [Ignavibacteria bacterium CG_4_8_14_3_um_filter_37_9]|nr:30S ribosomal protein S12 methylthiotransferase RimO [Ignavibacteria bacterium]OIO16619.1 MAG: ribosomal protein S12 methylthiotransferase RimO [Ignavibacteria bacterium CG1_02_37_35]PIP76201.1 MAG: 30S ribosomal protein S12 methylthiotransferase RimO [Ignavibacteria bacterium CG22_combo_CG10-13_8_21_14_all_37_15]PIS45521.1 MAG: 30S ribosomal protein S12 methylthiotransferase RimO [Ignavibacteria bacterium CG08_land_8_20_14_0_20_37_9]PIW98971.1 MAG: 30S ribosomal protein S12 methylthiotransf
MAKQNKVCVITLGCSKNTVDSERLMRQLEANNFKLQSDPNEAETIIINTCGFIEAAKEESVNTILNAIAMKNEGRIKKVIVAGCLSERYKEDLQKEIPEVDVFFGTENYEGIIKEIGGELKRELLGERLLTTPTYTAYLKISEGCDNPCSFCAIPLMRGKHQTKPIEELVSETEFLARNNTKELILIGQDTTDYGKDLYQKRNLAELMNRLSDVEGIEWIRLMYVYPSHFPDDLIDVMANNPKVCKYIDIPLQHISDDVLRSMRRGITKRRTVKTLNELREKIPGVTIRTTFIVGYPNETKKDFEELCNFVKEFKFDRIGVFTYSVEENTPSYLLGDPIPEKEKIRRKNKLMKIQQDISHNRNRSLIGKEFRIVVDGREGDYYIARSYRDAPEVDGEVLIPAKNKLLKVGKFYNATIFDCNEYDLYANV